jgi:hypothetical protein
MLGGYSAAAIAIPVLLGGILLGCGGIRGLVSFYQSIFWWVVSFLTVVTVGGISKVYPGRWGSLLEWHLEKPILRGICEIMKSGYIFLAAFAMIEFVVYLYTMVERRKRLMLGTAIALPVIISVMGSLFVIGILGIESLSQGKKGILNIVGALKLPFTEISHLGILVSGLFVIFGISAIGVHFVFAGEAMEHAGGKTPGKLFIYGLLVFVLLLIADRWLLTSAFPYLAAGYICMVDLPLSVILPGFLVRKKAGIWKMAAEVVGILGMVFLFTGCSRPAIEDVDYLTMVIVNVRESTPLYTFVVDSISDNADQETVEEIFESTAAGFEQSILEYNNSHAKTLDISHTEYIVVPDEDTFKIISEEMNEAYPTAYVEIIYQENIIDQAGDNGIRKFTESHYKGKSLAETE